jgi:hypothetical protein
VWEPRGVTDARRRPLSPVDAALVAEACSKSDLVWLRPLDEPRARAAWHVWHDDAVCVVYGTGEQMLPLLQGEVEVVARSKENGARVVTFVADAETVPAGTPEWDAAVFRLAASRLNAQDPATQKDRWASGALVALLRPVWVTAAGPGDDDTPSGAEPPPGGPGTTLARRPFHASSRQRRAARLRRRSS